MISCPARRIENSHHLGPATLDPWLVGLSDAASHAAAPRPGVLPVLGGSTISGFGTYISSVAFGVLVVADLGGPPPTSGSSRPQG